jgi:class 3 adenylate cyclase
MSELEVAAGLVASDDLRRIDQYRRDKNTSVLVVMFTDITGSTEFAEKHGEDAYNTLRLRHNKILLGIIERDDAGRFIKNIGDAIMAVFAKPSDAVERALEIQRTLREHNASASASERIVIRIGMHMGQVAKDESTSTDVFGRHVNRAARVESITRPGHILITRPVYDSAKGWVDNKRYAFVEHGEYRLKGIADRTDIVEPYEKGLVRPASPRIASFRERLKRWPLVPLLVIAVGALFLTVLNILITPLIQYRLAKSGVDFYTVRVWGPGWGRIGLVLRLAHWLGENWAFILLALAAILLADHMMHYGIRVVRRRYRLLTFSGLVLALLTGVILFAETCAMALMLSV